MWQTIPKTYTHTRLRMEFRKKLLWGIQNDLTAYNFFRVFFTLSASSRNVIFVSLYPAERTFPSDTFLKPSSCRMSSSK